MTDTLNVMPWVEKYRPKKIDDITQDKKLIDLFINTIKTKNMTHFLFYGPSGTGKTSAILAIGREIFKEHFSKRVIEFNASDDRGINAVREKITNEARKYVTELESDDGTIIPPYKIIILDEADSMTDEAQDALRVIIEQYSTVTRFCFICNYIGKITDAIKSRCSLVYFKKLSDTCIIDKLKEISIKEDMILNSEILKTIIEVSNGDMRKAIILLQNLKYLYNYKKKINKPLGKMTIHELKFLTNLNCEENSTEISQKDIYNIAASIDKDDANKIINDTLECKNIFDISKLSKNIIATGYPIDNILLQLNNVILETNKLNDEEKARIIIYSGNIFFKMKECSNEYIQLLDYLSCIYGIKNKNPIYFN